MIKSFVSLLVVIVSLVTALVQCAATIENRKAEHAKGEKTRRNGHGSNRKDRS